MYQRSLSGNHLVARNTNPFKLAFTVNILLCFLDSNKTISAPSPILTSQFKCPTRLRWHRFFREAMVGSAPPVAWFRLGPTAITGGRSRTTQYTEDS